MCQEKACVIEGQTGWRDDRMIPDIKKTEARSGEPRNYTNPDPLNCGLGGKSITVTLVNGRIESGNLRKPGNTSLRWWDPMEGHLLLPSQRS